MPKKEKKDFTLPGAKEALEQMKYEIANELGINNENSYSKNNGIAKKLVKISQTNNEYNR